MLSRTALSASATESEPSASRPGIHCICYYTKNVISKSLQILGFMHLLFVISIFSGIKTKMHHHCNRFQGESGGGLTQENLTIKHINDSKDNGGKKGKK